MTELEDIFAELGISHYLHDFIEQGFDTWDTILDIKESDFDALGVKLGHRRRIQRRIANSRGLSADRALDSPSYTPGDEKPADEQRAAVGRTDSRDTAGGDGGASQGAKRKYRRHPKPDGNAPDRPPSAYVIFSNKMREDLKGRNLSFTEIAKLVGEHWQNLLPLEKEPFENQASTAKEKYNNELLAYKKTEYFRTYSQYLAEFKVKQSSRQTEASKRPKLEAHPSTASTGTSSGASQYGLDTPGPSHTNSSVVSAQWPSNDIQSPKQGGVSSMNNGIGVPQRSFGSPAATSPTVLPGYRESIYAGGYQSLPWRDGPREDGLATFHQLPRIASADGSRGSHPGVADSLNLTGSVQHANLPELVHTDPPSLKTEMTNRSTSTNSTGSSVFLPPRTPMEPSLDRAMPLPSLYSQSQTGSYENQLPPMNQRPSLSPQSTIAGTQKSPTAINPVLDFPTTIPPLRGYASFGTPAASPADSRHRDLLLPDSTDDALDPVSALLRAGEIVSRNSRSHP